MFVVIASNGGIVEDVMLFPLEDKALDYIETILETYGIDKETFNRDKPGGYWTNNPDLCENEILLREEPVQGAEALAVITWSQEDVLHRAKERGMKITEEQARTIIGEIDRKHDASMGISWDTIDCYLDYL